MNNLIVFLFGASFGFLVSGLIDLQQELSKVDQTLDEINVMLEEMTINE